MHYHYQRYHCSLGRFPPLSPWRKTCCKATEEKYGTAGRERYDSLTAVKESMEDIDQNNMITTDALSNRAVKTPEIPVYRIGKTEEERATAPNDIDKADWTCWRMSLMRSCGRWMLSRVIYRRQRRCRLHRLTESILSIVPLR